MSIFKKLAGATVLYGLSSIVARVLNYFLVPLHTHKYFGFAAADYGVLSELYVYAAFLNIAYTYGMETTFFRYAKGDNTDTVFGTIFSYLLLSTGLISLFLLLFSGYIAGGLGYPEQQHLIVWLVLTIAIDTLLVLPFARLRQEQRAKKFAFTKIANILVNVFFNIFFLVFCRLVHEGALLPSLQPLVAWIYFPSLGIGYIFLANLLASAFVFLLLYPLFLDIRLRYDWQAFRPMLRYGYPLLFMGFAGMINEMLDRILLKYYLPENFYPEHSNMAAVGIYSGVYKLAIFMTLAIQAFKYAAEPFFFAQSEDKQAPALFARLMRYFVLLLCLMWVGVSLNLDWLKYFLGRSEYHEGLVVVPILLLANLFLGIYYNLSVWFKITDRTHYGTWIAASGASVTLLANFLLIPYLGYVGSALATLAAYFTMAVVCYILGRRFYPIPYPMSAIAFYITVSGAAIYIGIFYVHFEVFYWKIIVKNIFLLTVLLIFILPEVMRWYRQRKSL